MSTSSILYIVIGSLGSLILVTAVIAVYFWYRSTKAPISGAGRASTGGGRFGGEVQSEMVDNPMRSTLDVNGQPPSKLARNQDLSNEKLPA